MLKFQIKPKFTHSTNFTLMLTYDPRLFCTRRSHCEYVEEFPLQALPQFSSISGHGVSNRGVIVLVLQYGTKKIDFLGKNRSQNDWTKAWLSNFLHPVFYYYDKLPTGKKNQCSCDKKKKRKVNVLWFCQNSLPLFILTMQMHFIEDENKKRQNFVVLKQSHLHFIDCVCVQIQYFCDSRGIFRDPWFNVWPTILKILLKYFLHLSTELGIN